MILTNYNENHPHYQDLSMIWQLLPPRTPLLPPWPNISQFWWLRRSCGWRSRPHRSLLFRSAARMWTPLTTCSRSTAGLEWILWSRAEMGEVRYVIFVLIRVFLWKTMFETQKSISVLKILYLQMKKTPKTDGSACSFGRLTFYGKQCMQN